MLVEDSDQGSIICTSFRLDSRFASCNNSLYKDLDFSNDLRNGSILVTVHVWKNDRVRHSCLDWKTTRHPGYTLSLSCRWLIEKTFGWLKQTEPLR